MSSEIGEIMVSVVVPFRKEPKLYRLLSSLKAQKFPSDQWELILVSDHNSEEENEVARKYIRELQFQNFKFLELSNIDEGKKAALRSGIHHAAGKIILTTDADCVINPQWINVMTESLAKGEGVMVIGNVRIDPKEDVLTCYQELEHFAFYSITALTALLGNPQLCTGASLAFLRSWFISVNGYDGNERISSGDDMFLLKKAIRGRKKTIHCNSLSGTVITSPADSWEMLFAQRQRWLSKTLFFPDKLPLALFILDTLFRCSLMAWLIWGIWNELSPGFYIIPLFIRWFIDFLLVFLPALRFRRVRTLLWSVPFFFIATWIQCRLLYGIVNNPEITWKGRVVVQKP